MKSFFSKIILFASFCFLISFSAWVEDQYPPDVPEPGSSEAIARDTTDPKYISSWVSYVPESKTVPSPSDFLGHIAGAAGELVSATKIHAYMRELDKASDRVFTEVIGHTEEGREILLVAISDEKGIANLNAYKEASARLADPRKTTPEQVEEVIKNVKPFYYINCAIHADEDLSPDMSLELAYRLAVSNDPMIRRIRENLVVLINPVANVDGREKMVDWFYRYLKGKTDYDSLPRQSPPYWGKYVYVDANRDAHQLDLSSTQAVAKMYFEYHPVVIHDLHEAIPLLQTWNGTGPYNPGLDPIMISEFLEMSFHEMSRMSEQGMPGVWTWDFGEGYGQPFTESIAMNHNGIGRGYETFGNTTAETVTRKLDSSDLTVEWYRPLPPPEKEFKWSHRNGVNYAETGVLAILDYCARQPETMLRSFYKKSYNSWQKGVKGNPYAFVIPANQNDPHRVDHMINRLLKQKIEIGVAKNDFKTKEGSYKAGSYVIKLDQPYRNYAVDLLLPQEFPENAQYQPYDDVSWAFPVNYGLDTFRIDDRGVMDVAVQPITEDVHTLGKVSGTGTFLLADHGQEGLLAARYRLSNYKINIAEKAFKSGGIDYPAGSWIISDQSGLGDSIGKVADELGLDFQGVGAVPDVPQHEVPAARIGVWVPWADTDMIGWIRLTLDQEKIPYTYLRDEEIKAGNLNQKVDVILYGNVLLGVQEQILGIQNPGYPMPFKKTDATPSHGAPAESDDITGGIGWKGLANLQEFVESGGLFITMGRGSQLALESGLVRNVKRVNRDDVSTPGIEVRAKFTQPNHPIAYGYPQVTSVFRSNYGIYDPPKKWLTASYCTSCLDGPWDYSHVVLQWGTRDFDSQDSGGSSEPPLIVSGGGKKVDFMQGRPAILDMPEGKGHVIVFNFNPMHRDMNYSDFRLLWNGILNYQYIVNGK